MVAKQSSWFWVALVPVKTRRFNNTCKTTRCDCVAVDGCFWWQRGLRVCASDTCFTGREQIYDYKYFECFKPSPTPRKKVRVDVIRNWSVFAWTRIEPFFFSTSHSFVCVINDIIWPLLEIMLSSRKTIPNFEKTVHRRDSENKIRLAVPSSRPPANHLRSNSYFSSLESSCHRPMCVYTRSGTHRSPFRPIRRRQTSLVGA